MRFIIIITGSIKVLALLLICTVSLLLWSGLVLPDAGFNSVGGGVVGNGEDEDKVVVYTGVGCVTAQGLAAIDKDTLLVSDSYSTMGPRLVKRVKLDRDSNTATMSDFSTLPYKQPGGLATGKDNIFIYVCDTIESRIYTHKLATGKLTGAIATAGMPWNLRVLDDGTIWYLTTDGRLHRRKPDGVTFLVHDIEADKVAEIKTAFDFVFDDKLDLLYVTRQQPGAVIAVNCVDGSMRVVSDKFVNPEGIELGKTGQYLYVADTEDDKVYRLKIDGSDLTVIMDGAELGFEMPISVRRLDDRLFVSARTRSEASGGNKSSSYKPVILEYYIVGG